MKYILLAIIVATTAASCLIGSERSEKKRHVIATINGVPIYVDEFKRELQRVRLDDDEGQPSVASIKTQKGVLLDDLIERRLLLEEADRNNVLVGINEVEGAYQRTRAGWRPEELEEILQGKDTTAAEVKAEVRDMLMIKKYFGEHVFARIAVTDNDIATYLEQHPETQIIPEQVRARQIVVKTEEKANEVLRVIRKGKTFEEAAVKFSLSPEAKNGGDLGFFSRGFMPRIFDEVCFKLRVGEVSKVVQSDYGHHIFKVVEKRAESLKPVDQVRDDAEKELRRQRESEAHGKKIAALRKAATVIIHERELARVH